MAPIIANGLLALGGDLIKRFFPDKEEQAQKQLEFAAMVQAGELESLKSVTAIIEAEANSEHWLTANWRPLTMLVFVFIIANNYILYPYLSLFFDKAPILEIPPDMWQLLKIGIGGYTVGRSGEKMVTAFKGKK